MDIETKVILFGLVVVFLVLKVVPKKIDRSWSRVLNSSSDEELVWEGLKTLFWGAMVVFPGGIGVVLVFGGLYLKITGG